MGELQGSADCCLKAANVSGHGVGGALFIAVAHCFENRAVFEYRIIKVFEAIEREEPDAQCVRVIVVEYTFEEWVARAAIDEAVQALVECHQIATLRLTSDRVERVQQVVEFEAVVVGEALGGEAGRRGFKHLAGFGKGGEVAGVDSGDEHSAAGVDVDEAFVGQGAQGFPNGGAAHMQALHQVGFADHRAGG